MLAPRKIRKGGSRRYAHKVAQLGTLDVCKCQANIVQGHVIQPAKVAEPLVGLDIGHWVQGARNFAARSDWCVGIGMRNGSRFHDVFSGKCMWPVVAMYSECHVFRVASVKRFTEVNN